MSGIWSLIIVLIMVGFAALYFFQHWKEGKKYSRGIKNYGYLRDGCRMVYIYQISYSEAEITGMLAHKNVKDKLNYVFDSATRVIWFSNPETTMYDVNEKGVGYQLKFQQENGREFLILEQINRILPKNSNVVPMLMNAFWAEKAAAEPIEYLQQDRVKGDKNAK